MSGKNEVNYGSVPCRDWLNMIDWTLPVRDWPILQDIAQKNQLEEQLRTNLYCFLVSYLPALVSRILVANTRTMFTNKIKLSWNRSTAVEKSDKEKGFAMTTVNDWQRSHHWHMLSPHLVLFIHLHTETFSVSLYVKVLLCPSFCMFFP